MSAENKDFGDDLIIDDDFEEVEEVEVEEKQPEFVSGMQEFSKKKKKLEQEPKTKKLLSLSAATAKRLETRWMELKLAGVKIDQSDIAEAAIKEYLDRQEGNK